MKPCCHSRLCLLGISFVLCVVSSAAGAIGEQEFDRQRAALVKVIEQDVRDTSLYLDKEALDPRVMQAMGKVRRHVFVPEYERRLAYRNHPLPIGHGQTISQPYIVAIMTDMLKPRPDHKVLEVGTGSGYQAAVLAELVKRVYTIEIIEPLGERARTTLLQTGHNNVEVRIGDGYYGWKEHAPFDAIVVTAAAGHIPPPLIQQLKPGGRMVIPVGSRFMTQQLVLVEKSYEGEVTTRQMLPVRFVPLTGGH
ncbi:MAG: protein-L-isoaspartate(D-aspartate) O-methyltransferase [Pseudomonadota bacterium]|nr:MAG: protein-L-isoaspartate(D-aspartate) O-methyltransferase [Pseudomonadota bacterium]